MFTFLIPWIRIIYYNFHLVYAFTEYSFIKDRIISLWNFGGLVRNPAGLPGDIWNEVRCFYCPSDSFKAVNALVKANTSAAIGIHQSLAV